MERKTNIKAVTAAVFVATFMTAIEGTIITTAMPTIVGSLKGIEIMNWVFSIYLLTNAMLTPVYGKLADMIGRKPVFLFGTAIFMIGSALCGMSYSMVHLIIARAIQGIGAGAMMPVAFTIIADLYSAEKRGKILGLTSTAWGVASVVGPLAGGIVVDLFSWHWIFFINVPIGFGLIWLIGRYLIEEKRPKTNKKMDMLGSLMSMMMLMFFLIGIQYLGDEGLSLRVGMFFLISLIGLVVFIQVEKRAEDPLISLELFRNRIFVVVNLVAALVSGFLMGVEVYIPMWMQGVLGMSAAIGGLILAPQSIMWVYGSSVASNWLTIFSLRKNLLIALLVTLIGGTLLFLMPFATPFYIFFVISAVIGTGMGATIVITTVSAQNSVPHKQLGVATSFNTLAKTLGQTMMIAVFGIIFNAATAKELTKLTIAVPEDAMNQLVNPHTAKLLPTESLQALRHVLYQGLHSIYGVAILLVIVAIVSALTLTQKTGTIRTNK